MDIQFNSSKFDWDKVADIRMADTREENFIPLLHDIDADKLENLHK